MTAYWIWCSIIRRILVVAIAEFGPFEKNMFGKPSTQTKRYVLGFGVHLSLKSTWLRPIMGNGNLYDVSKP